MQTERLTLRGKKIVICEDEGLILMQWKRLLDRHGAAVTAYSPSGEGCVEETLKEKPDIVLVDAGLSGMDGWEASRQILNNWNTCIVMVTGQADDVVKDKLNGVAVSGWIKKPASGDDFIRSILTCYEGRAATDLPESKRKPGSDS